MSRNNDYTTGNLLDFDYFIKDYKLIPFGSSKQTKLKDPRLINFIGRLDRQDTTTTKQQYFSLFKNQKNLLLNF